MVHFVIGFSFCKTFVMSPTLLLLICTIALSASEQDPLAFEIKGLRVGLEKGEALSRTNQAIIDSNLSAEKGGIEIYQWNDDTRAPAKIQLTFLDKKLIRIDAEYSNSEVNRIGGWELIRTRMIERLGKPNLIDTLRLRSGPFAFLGDAFWSFDRLSRSFSFSAQTGHDVFTVTVWALDSRGWKLLKDRREKIADTGF